MNLKALISALVITAMPFTANAAGDVAAGKAKSVACSSCHGTDGKAAIPTYPSLAGQNPKYIELAIKAYKTGQRSGGQAATMTAMAAPLSDADIANLAAYYGSLK